MCLGDWCCHCRCPVLSVLASGLQRAAGWVCDAQSSGRAVSHDCWHAEVWWGRSRGSPVQRRSASREPLDYGISRNFRRLGWVGPLAGCIGTALLNRIPAWPHLCAFLRHLRPTASVTVPLSFWMKPDATSSETQQGKED